MFICPICGGHSFRSTTLRDGSVERECKGTVYDQIAVSLAKLPDGIGPTSKQPKTLRERRDVLRAEATPVAPGSPAALALQAAAVAPTVVKQHARACTFLWLSEDDIRYGVTEDDVREQAELQEKARAARAAGNPTQD
jgi:hypothetical protein